jgi:hypothetical protein
MRCVIRVSGVERKLLMLTEEIRQHCITMIGLQQQAVQQTLPPSIDEELHLPVTTLDELELINDELKTGDMKSKLVCHA